jgi:hypothetical protein
MGFDFMKRFAQVAVARLDSARLQLLEVYGTGPRK